MMQASKADRVATRAMRQPILKPILKPMHKVADKLPRAMHRQMLRVTARVAARQLKPPIHRQEDLLSRGQTKLNPSVMATMARTTFRSEPIVNL